MARNWLMMVKVPTEEYLETDITERVQKTLEAQDDINVIELGGATGLGDWDYMGSEISGVIEAETDTAPWVLEVVLTAGHPVTIGLDEDLVGAELRSGLEGEESGLEGVSL